MSRDVARYIWQLAQQSAEAEIENTKRMIMSAGKPEYFDATAWKQTIMSLVKKKFLSEDDDSTVSMLPATIVKPTGSKRYYDSLPKDIDPNEKIFVSETHTSYPGQKIYTIVTDPFHRKLISEVIRPLGLKWGINVHSENMYIYWGHWL